MSPCSHHHAIDRTPPGIRSLSLNTNPYCHLCKVLAERSYTPLEVPECKKSIITEYQNAVHSATMCARAPPLPAAFRMNAAGERCRSRLLLIYVLVLGLVKAFRRPSKPRAPATRASK